MLSDTRTRTSGGLENVPVELWWAAAGAVAMAALLIGFVVVTVRHHGRGRPTMAPPAVPWFVGAMAVGVLTLAILGFWGTSG